MPCTSLPPDVPRNSCRSASICTNSDSCPFTNVVTAAASSISSSLSVSVVAIFLIGSSSGATRERRLGLQPALGDTRRGRRRRALGGVADHRVRSPRRRQSRFSNVSGWNSFSTTPGTTCGTGMNPPPVPEPGAPAPSSSVPFAQVSGPQSTAPDVQVWPRAPASLIALYPSDWTNTSPGLPPAVFE